MLNQLTIVRPTKEDIKSIYNVFEKTITNAFEKEGISYLKDDILDEIESKKQLLHIALLNNDTTVYFLVARINNEVIGTISYSPCNDDVKKFTNNKLEYIGELGSLYVLPNYQNMGVASELIHSLIEHLHKIGVKQFCLDCGYKLAQKRWLKKFGNPYKIVKDYWGKDYDHMIWLCDVKDYI